jgi:hypothetical protein
LSKPSFVLGATGVGAWTAVQTVVGSFRGDAISVEGLLEGDEPPTD